jgi:coiled-coil and C2 domain-containing protein 2A
MKDDICFMEKQGLDEHEKRNEEQIPTYLNVTISLEPLITLARENDREYYQGFEKGPFLQVGSEWVKNLEVKFRKTSRQYKVFLENINGQSVFIPKYLNSLKPHESFFSGKEDKKAIEKAARYVSLIPFLDDTTLFKDMPDLTCTS